VTSSFDYEQGAGLQKGLEESPFIINLSKSLPEISLAALDSGISI
jgi:hypothetical protein